MAGVQIDPPIMVDEKFGGPIALGTVEQVIEFVRKHDDFHDNWKDLRKAAFIAAAVPDPANIQ